MELPTSSISSSQGLHFTIVDTVPEIRLARRCSLYIVHPFPVDVFVDPYELEQRVQDKISPNFKVWGLTDLELPVSSVKDTEQGSLLMLGPLEVAKTATNVEVSVPIHARYPLPSKDASHANVTLPNPTLLTACNTRQKSRHEKEVVEKLFASYELPFDFKTTDVRTVTFSSDSLIIQVPTGKQANLAFVEPLTIIVVLLATYYMGRAFWRASFRFRQEKKQRAKQN